MVSVQPPTPPTDAAAAPHAPDSDDGLSPELATAVAGARRRAMRDGDRQIDTAHLLHSLLEADPAVREAVGSCEQGSEQLVRLLGYLVQRSIGYGLQWQGSVEDSGAVPRVREDGWSPSAATAMEGTRKRAAGRGAAQAEGADLLALLAQDTECRAVEVMRRAGVDNALLLRRLATGFDESARSVDVSALRQGYRG